MTTNIDLKDDVDSGTATKIKILQDNLSALVDEKHALTLANERLAHTLKEVIAEKEELRKQLALKSGLGIHENRPETFRDIAPPRRKPEGDNL